MTHIKVTLATEKDKEQWYVKEDPKNGLVDFEEVAEDKSKNKKDYLLKRTKEIGKTLG